MADNLNAQLIVIRPPAGPVWAHRRVPIPIAHPEVTKSVLYRNYLVPAGVDAMWEVLVKHYYGIKPLIVDHNDPNQLLGSYRAKLSNEERAVQFETMTAAQVAHTIAFSDSRPGAIATLHGESKPCVSCLLGFPRQTYLHHHSGIPGTYALFSAWVEETGAAAASAKDAAPGQVLGHRDGAILVRPSFAKRGSHHSHQNIHSIEIKCCC
jgi:methionyl-tRNA formyltransferase